MTTAAPAAAVVIGHPDTPPTPSIHGCGNRSEPRPALTVGPQPPRVRRKSAPDDHADNQRRTGPVLEMRVAQRCSKQPMTLPRHQDQSNAISGQPVRLDETMFTMVTTSDVGGTRQLPRHFRWEPSARHVLHEPPAAQARAPLRMPWHARFIPVILPT